MRDGQIQGKKQKQGQAQHRDRVARGWKKWWPVLEEQWKSVSDRLIDLAGIRPGQRVLDIATGIGEPALTIAAHVGPRGSVVGIDQSSHMLTLARNRKDKLGLKNVDFLEMGADAPDLPAGIFDAIICRWGLLTLLNLKDAFSRYRTLLKPTGRFATTVWGKPAQVPFMSIPFGLAQSVLKQPTPPPDQPSAFGLTPRALIEAMTVTGFTEVRSESIEVGLLFASPAEYAEHLRDVSAPLVSALSAAPAKKQQEFWKRLDELVAPYVQPDGSLLFPNTTVCVYARCKEK